MAVLIRSLALVGALAAACAGCYDPLLRDCTVTCKLPTDCAPEQTCGHDGFCVGSAADLCTISGDHPDAAPVDKVDAAPPKTIDLHVTVTGMGSVVVDDEPAMTCSATPISATCTYEVTADTAHHLVARPQPPRAFMAWTGACSGSATTCAVTPTADTDVGAMFMP
jgi:hypothetical protein